MLTMINVKPIILNLNKISPVLWVRTEELMDRFQNFFSKRILIPLHKFKICINQELINISYTAMTSKPLNILHSHNCYLLRQRC
jgi:hypothetical protein